jgi:hypothetical protein
MIEQKTSEEKAEEHEETTDQVCNARFFDGDADEKTD